MNKVEGAIIELKKIHAMRTASIGTALLVLLRGEEDTSIRLEHMRWAELRIVGALDSIRDLGDYGETSARIGAIDVFASVMLEGIEEMRQEIGKEEAA